MNEKIIQDKNQKAEWTPIYNMYLLFEEIGIRPDSSLIAKKLSEKLGKIDLISNSKSKIDDSNFTFLALTEHLVEFQDATVPAQLLITNYNKTDILKKLTPLELSQQWFCPNSDEIIEKTKYAVMISDFMASCLENNERMIVLTEFVETMVELFPNCIGVYFEPCAMLLSSDAISDNKQNGEHRGLNLFMNIRFFNIENTDEMLIDSYGLYKFGIPDIQYHFKGLEPNDVVNHCFNVASYIFTGNVDIKDGETIDGLKNGKLSQDIRWHCQHELSLIQPEREVLDINTNEFVAGNRE